MKFFTYIYQKRTIDAIHWSAVVLDYCNVLCNVFLLILIDPNILSWSQMFFPVLSTSRQSILNCNILSTDALHRVIMFTNFVLKLNGIVTQPYLGLEKLPLICFFFCYLGTRSRISHFGFQGSAEYMNLLYHMRAILHHYERSILQTM